MVTQTPRDILILYAGLLAAPWTDALELHDEVFTLAREHRVLPAVLAPSDLRVPRREGGEPADEFVEREGWRALLRIMAVIPASQKLGPLDVRLPNVPAWLEERPGKDRRPMHVVIAAMEDSSSLMGPLEWAAECRNDGWPVAVRNLVWPMGRRLLGFGDEVLRKLRATEDDLRAINV